MSKKSSAGAQELKKGYPIARAIAAQWGGPRPPLLSLLHMVRPKWRSHPPQAQAPKQAPSPTARQNAQYPLLQTLGLGCTPKAWLWGAVHYVLGSRASTAMALATPTGQAPHGRLHPLRMMRSPLYITSSRASTEMALARARKPPTGTERPRAGSFPRSRGGLWVFSLSLSLSLSLVLR